MTFTISISHFVSDFLLPKALKKGSIKSFLLFALLFIILLSIWWIQVLNATVTIRFNFSVKISLGDL
ncbi:hypothetical protein ACPDHN_13800, partial [Myroides odoratimimus]